MKYTLTLLLSIITVISFAQIKKGHKPDYKASDIARRVSSVFDHNDTVLGTATYKKGDSIKTVTATRIDGIYNELWEIKTPMENGDSSWQYWGRQAPNRSSVILDNSDVIKGWYRFDPYDDKKQKPEVRGARKGQLKSSVILDNDKGKTDDDGGVKYELKNKNKKQ